LPQNAQEEQNYLVTKGWETEEKGEEEKREGTGKKQQRTAVKTARPSDG